MMATQHDIAPGARRAFQAAERRAESAEAKARDAEARARAAEDRADRAEAGLARLDRLAETLATMGKRLDAIERGSQPKRAAASSEFKRRTISAADLLNGYVEIGAFLGWPTQTAKRRALDGIVPTFKIGGTVCARRSTLSSWISEQDKGGRNNG